ncbi:MAG: PAS domain S-box protein [Smithellaceae bacterium]|jgi:PAS domain S-box-containing protein
MNNNIEIEKSENKTRRAQKALQKAQDELGNREQGEQSGSRLDNLLSPENDAGEEDAGYIIDFQAIQELMNFFYKFTGIANAILDLKGNILIATGWQDICTKFHRVHPQTIKHCIESDVFLSANVEEEKYTLYKCKNNLWDMATPIIVDGRHIANLFLGQFFYEDEMPDYEFFINQAKKYGFNKKEYLAALDRVPRRSRKTVANMIEFCTRFAGMISQLSYRNIQLIRSLAEQKLAEEALRQSEEKYNQFFRTSRDCVFITSKDGSWIDLNDAAVELFGYASREELRQVKIPNLYTNKNERAKFSGIIAESGYVREFPVDLRRKDGSVRHTLITAVACCDAEGNVVGFQGTMRDITERRRAEEEAMKERADFLQTLIDTLPNPVFYKNREGRYTGFNKAWEEFTGRSRQELIGKTDYDLGPVDVARIYEEKDNELFANPGKQAYEFLFKNGSGELRDVIFNKATTMGAGNRVTGLVGVVVDITERNRAEEALKASEAKYRLIVDTANEGVWMLDEEGRTTFVNARMAEMIGYTAEEIIGLKFAFFIFEEDLPDHEARVRTRRQCLAEQYERRVRHKNGQVVWAIISAVPVLDADNRFQGSFAMFTDITESKRAEEALRESEQRLADIIDFLPDATFAVDLNGKVIVWNRAIEEMTGIKASDMLGKGDYEYALPFYGMRSSMLIDLVFISAEEIKKKYHFVKREGDVLIAETNAPVRGVPHALWVKARPLYDSRGNVVGAIESIRDITDVKRAEKALKNRERDLNVKSRNLEELNAALKVLLKQRQQDKEELEEKILANIKQLALPYIERLKKSRLKDKEADYVGILESNLKNIISPFTSKLSSQYLNLTPREIQTANLIKEGKTTKEIAELLNVSPGTVEFHRENIRIKLDLKNKKSNLRTYLMKLS